MESKSVDANTILLEKPVTKARFVARLKNERKLISKIMTELGLNSTITRLRGKQETRKTTSGKDKKTTKKTKPQRTSTRVRKQKQNTTMKLRSTSL